MAKRTLKNLGRLCSNVGALEGIHMKTILALFGSLTLLLTAQAQSYSIDWFTIDGGGAIAVTGLEAIALPIGLGQFP